MLLLLLILVIVITLPVLYMQQARFGKNPTGKRLQRMRQSPNYREGKFQNLNPTPQLTEGHTILEVIFDFFFRRKPRRAPAGEIPSMKTDLITLPRNEDIMVWFGHSSYFMQLDGRRFVVDPVLSGHASPIASLNKSFKGSDRYTVGDLPELDYLFITHDHYDHLDYDTVTKLQPKVKKVICGLGVGAHLEHWGYKEKQIIEMDWNETQELEPGFVVHSTPARHFSGRKFSRNVTLWLSYVLQTPSMKIFIGGDSGYDKHFAEIGKKHGPFDLAVLENGQYDKKWRYIHAQPEEVLPAAKDLNAKRVFPAHYGKFVMANHPWDDPLLQITAFNKTANIPVITPMIGEKVYLKDADQKFKEWWVDVK